MLWRRGFQILINCSIPFTQFHSLFLILFGIKLILGLKKLNNLKL